MARPLTPTPHSYAEVACLAIPASIDKPRPSHRTNIITRVVGFLSPLASIATSEATCLFPSWMTHLSKDYTLAYDNKRWLGVLESFKAYLNIPMAKVHIANIPARDSSDSPVYSEKALKKTLRLNPAIKGLRFFTPHWEQS
ncbi:hypothetical protein B0J17DRAFT_632079 [Rhizoctonia solani]|nr:hypothetical protein B0J17DRAFT_632079 [Rhizoctonia solani]